MTGLQQQEDRIMIGPNFIGGGVQQECRSACECGYLYIERILSAQITAVKSNYAGKDRPALSIAGRLSKSRRILFAGSQRF